MHFDCALCKSLFVGEVAVVGEIDVLERADDETDVLRKDERIAGKTSSFPSGVCRI